MDGSLSQAAKRTVVVVKATHHSYRYRYAITWHGHAGPGPTALALLESSRHTDADERKQGWMLTNLRVCT